MFKTRNDQKDWIMKGYDHLENKNKIVLNYSDPIFNFSAQMNSVQFPNTFVLINSQSIGKYI